jgi:membrane protease YdiL (CAAX protease family)
MRMNRSAILLSLGLVIAALVAPGVDGVEHTVALLTGFSAGLIARWAYSRTPRSWSRSLRDARLVRFLRRRRPALAVMRDRC